MGTIRDGGPKCETQDPFTGKSCGGYLTVEANDEQAVCGVLASCDGCEQPGL